jgi:predicted site-specific integrase-resolvase
MVTPEEASRLRNVSTRGIYRWVEEGSLHYLESQDGLLFVCVKSLLR